MAGLGSSDVWQWLAVAVVAMRLVVGVDGDSGKEGGMGDKWLQLRDYSNRQNSWHFKIIDLR